MIRRRLLAIVLLLAALTGCAGSGTAATDPSGATSEAGTDPDSTGQPDADATGPAEESGSGDASGEQPAASTEDPHSLTGPSTAAQVPATEPVTADPDQQLPVTVTGEDGQEVTIEDTSRMLALDLYGTLAEITVGLGLGEDLVGRTVSNTQDVLADLPVVTENGHELNVEAILALEPTFVLMDTTMGPPEVPDQLRASGVPVLVVSSDRGVDLITEQIQLVAEALGVPAAGDLLTDRFEGDLEAAHTYVDALTEGWDPLRMAFLYVRGTGSVFFVMGEGSGADDLIEHVGGLDTASDAGLADVTPATAEAVIALDPELIITMTGGLDSTGGVQGLLDRPGIAQTTVGETERIVDMADGAVLSFGPSYPAVLTALADAIYQP
ncbi:ABC transporter substrate-binding protein [Ruania albidiflava]|uniref:ABC transporter substrate-binding protein n=1 Tax=Ruania albidiflava TaxID=366586 RepID=UPI0023F157FE|nr:ABC transporter substrate-binding protein [Ruania albidiflava]